MIDETKASLLSESSEIRIRNRSSSLDTNQNTSMIFLKIRYEAIKKAIQAIRHKRLLLDERLSKAQVSPKEYQKEIVQLVVEGKKLRTELEKVSRK